MLKVVGVPFVAHVDQSNTSAEFDLDKELMQSEFRKEGYRRIMGYFYDLRPYLSQYVLETEFYGLQKMWGRDADDVVEFVRENDDLYGDVYFCIEIPGTGLDNVLGKAQKIVDAALKEKK